MFYWFCCGAATLLGAAWMILYTRGWKRYAYYIEALRGEETVRFPLKDVYPVGLMFMDAIRYSYDTPYDQGVRQQLLEVKEEKFVDFFIRVVWGAKVSMVLTVLPVGFALAVAGREPMALVLAVLLAGVLFYYIDSLLKAMLTSRHEGIVSQLPQALSKMVLLLGAGMTVREAWDKIAYSSGGELCQEMRRTSVQILNGISEQEAYTDFAARCNVKEVRKFVSLIVQNLSKGNAELGIMLKGMADEYWDEKKHTAKRKGEQASAKLLLPLCIMFIGIIIVLVVPMFANMGLGSL